MVSGQSAGLGLISLFSPFSFLLSSLPVSFTYTHLYIIINQFRKTLYLLHKMLIMIKH